MVLRGHTPKWHHPRILEAYRNGWVRYLKQSPWRMWVKRGLHRRVYMSSAVFTDETTLQALTTRWINLTKEQHCFGWTMASPRMHNIPAIHNHINSLVFPYNQAGRRNCTGINRAPHLSRLLQIPCKAPL